MPSYLVSGSAVATAVAGDVSGIHDAVAGEDAVAVESATRDDSGDLQFTLRVEAPDPSVAVETARRIADRLSPGSSVTLVE